MRRFAPVRAQMKEQNMASFVSSIRRNKNLTLNTSSSSTNIPVCKISPKPLYGSYHLAYRVLFDDGVQWILKVPVNGHHACFDGLAAQALTSEALTMRMIKQSTTIPIPTVHQFDASTDNDIGCPYILMDFLKGKPLWQGWFDAGASRSALEQFRARSLQTIAAAMFQLNQFTNERSGSLRFDLDGQPVDVASARVPDWLVEQDVMQGLTTYGEGCPYCEKGPVTDPQSSFLFMLDRRGNRGRDGPYQRGVREVYRLFVQWTLEKTNFANESTRKFVLAHPDFAVQNILVEDDGTLCGIIDWDGVAAVPLSIGSLKYPDWLTNDWRPNYSYLPGVAGQRENSPEELATYRVMYAQFMEMCSTITLGSSQAGKLNADITRMSLIASTLDLGAHDLKLTNDTIDIIFESLEALTAEFGDADGSDASTGSSAGTDTDEAEKDDSSAETGPTVIESSNSCGEENGVESLDSDCTAELASGQLPRNEDVEDLNETYLNARTTFSDKSGLEQEHHEAPSFTISRAEEVGQEQEVTFSRKARVAKWAFNLGEKGARRIIRALHKKETVDSKPEGKPGPTKEALGLGEKGCKGDSEVFHNEEGVSGLPSESSTEEALPIASDSRPISTTLEAAIGLCNHTETLLREVIARMHRDCVSENEVSNLKPTKTKSVLAFLKWLIAILKKMVQKPKNNDENSVERHEMAERQELANIVPIGTEHYRGHNANKGDRGWVNVDLKNTNKRVESEIVWTSIAAKVDESGIPIDLVKERCDMIAECIIQRLGQELQTEPGQTSHLTGDGVTTEAQSVQNQAQIVNTSDSDNPTSVHQPRFVDMEIAELKSANTCIIETEAAGNGMLGERIADVADAEVDITSPKAPIIAARAESVISEEADKPQPTKSDNHKIACPEPIVIAPDDLNLARVDPDTIQTHIGEYKRSEPESLLAKFEAANTIYNLGKATKAKELEPLSQEPEITGAQIMQREGANMPKSACDLTNPKSIEKANQKLRMILSGFAKPKALSTSQNFDITRAEGGTGAPTERLRNVKDEIPKQDLTSLRAIESANLDLRRMLSELQELKAPNLNLHHNVHLYADNDKDEVESEKHSQMSLFDSFFNADLNDASTKSPMAVQGGRWFETPRGSLKRLGNEQILHKGLDDQETLYKPESSFSENNGPSSKTSIANYEAEDLARGPNANSISPNPGPPQAVNVFQVPDDDEDDEDDSVLEEGEILERETRNAEVTNDEGAEPLSREVHGGTVKREPNHDEMIDTGHFTAGEICVALGNGGLDGQRMERLKRGFMALLDDTVGKRRR